MHYVAGRQCAYLSKFGDGSVRHPSFFFKIESMVCEFWTWRKQLLLMMLTGYATQLANCGKHHHRTPWTTAWHYFHLLHLRVVSCQRESFITNSALVKAVSLLDSHALAFQADTLNSTASYFSVLFEEILQPLGLLTLRLEHKTHILLRLRSQLGGGGEKLHPTNTVGFPKCDGVAGSNWWIWNFWST